MVYRARKKSKKVQIHLDLAKSNLDLIIRANERLKGNDNNFADVNCRLCLKLDDELKYFESESEFLNLIGQSQSESSLNCENEDESDSSSAKTVVDDDE